MSVCWKENSDSEYMEFTGQCSAGFVQYDGPILRNEEGTQLLMRWDDTIPGPRPLNETELRQVQREELSAEIDAQVPQFTATQTFEDVGKELDITRTSAAATDKRRELQETADQDLDTFDPTINPAPPQDGVDYSRLTVNIEYVTPWAGAPSNDIGFTARLQVREGNPNQGAEGRILVIDAPADTGAVLPFTQDLDDPTLWYLESRDGFKWADPNLPATLQLLWGAGSLPTSSKITSEQLHDRKAELVRYATAVGSI